jgi:hypothetical protein
LTGVAGSGKSGVIREFIERLRDLGVPHLAFRIDQHLDCTSPKALGKAIIDKDESPVATLKGIAPEQLSVLIVDQVDAVSEVSGRNGAVKRAVLRLVEDVRNFGSIRMVVACRTFDLDSDQRLKALKESHGVEHINVPLLDWAGEVEPILRQKAIDTGQLSGNQRSLLWQFTSKFTMAQRSDLLPGMISFLDYWKRRGKRFGLIVSRVGSSLRHSLDLQSGRVSGNGSTRPRTYSLISAELSIF